MADDDKEGVRVRWTVRERGEPGAEDSETRAGPARGRWPVRQPPAGRPRTPIRRWRDRSRTAQVDLFTRGALCLVPWSGLALAAPLESSARDGPTSATLALLLLGLVLAQSAVSVRGLHHALNAYLGAGRMPARLLPAMTALAVAALTVTVALVARSSSDMATEQAVLLSAFAVLPMLNVCCLTVGTARLYGGTAVVATALVAMLAAVGVPAAGLLGTAVALLFSASFALLTVRTSAWVLAALWEMDRAQDVRARLAVAEERLRFGRDMHDVLGRNLSVVALKSELAVRLARRGSAAAIDQMVEVQRLAQESQREMREVVRGYRRADLNTELAGARSVLTAADIDCRIATDATRLPTAVQSALGWVVREGTTNVLRHAEARHCSMTLRVRSDRRLPGQTGEPSRWAQLVVENDGAPTTTAAARSTGPTVNGSGIAGLQERVAALGGTVTPENRTAGVFRLTARLPLAETPPGDQAAAGRPAGRGPEEDGVRTEPAGWDAAEAGNRAGR